MKQSSSELLAPRQCALRKCESEVGISLPMLLFSLLGVMFFLGLAVDVTYLLLTQRRLQRAVDSAAIYTTQFDRSDATTRGTYAAMQQLLSRNMKASGLRHVTIQDFRDFGDGLFQERQLQGGETLDNFPPCQSARTAALALYRETYGDDIAVGVLDVSSICYALQPDATNGNLLHITGRYAVPQLILAPLLGRGPTTVVVANATLKQSIRQQGEPIIVSFVIDASSSIGSRLQSIRQALRHFSDFFFRTNTPLYASILITHNDAYYWDREADWRRRGIRIAPIQENAAGALADTPTSAEIFNDGVNRIGEENHTFPLTGIRMGIEEITGRIVNPVKVHQAFPHIQTLGSIAWHQPDFLLRYFPRTQEEFLGDLLSNPDFAAAIQVGRISAGAMHSNIRELQDLQHLYLQHFEQPLSNGRTPIPQLLVFQERSHRIPGENANYYPSGLQPGNWVDVGICSDGSLDVNCALPTGRGELAPNGKYDYLRLSGQDAHMRRYGFAHPAIINWHRLSRQTTNFQVQPRGIEGLQRVNGERARNMRRILIFIADGGDSDFGEASDSGFACAPSPVDGRTDKPEARAALVNITDFARENGIQVHTIGTFSRRQMINRRTNEPTEFAHAITALYRRMALDESVFTQPNLYAEFFDNNRRTIFFESPVSEANTVLSFKPADSETPLPIGRFTLSPKPSNGAQISCFRSIEDLEALPRELRGKFYDATHADANELTTILIDAMGEIAGEFLPAGQPRLVQ